MGRLRVCAALLACGLAVAGCAAQPGPTTSLYDRLGGESGIAVIVDGFIRELAEDEVTRHYFRSINIAGFRQRLESFLCVETGGACRYDGRSMRDSHATLGIDRVAFNRTVEHLSAALDSAGVAYTTKNALLAKLAPMEKDVVTVRIGAYRDN